MRDAGRQEDCPLPKKHARLRQAHALWHMTADSYGEPDQFTIHLNGTLQALRTVTWVLQKEGRRHPRFRDFEAWYAPHQVCLNADPLLRWAVDARNEVEHRGDLERLAVIENVAADIRGRGDVRGAMFIAEAELGEACERRGDCALVLSLATAAGDRRAFVTPFTRHDQSALVGKTRVLIRALPHFMTPIADALEEAGA